MRKKSSLLYISLLLALILASGHFIAEAYSLYWTLWWFDNVLHFWGGFTLGFFALYVTYESSIFGENISLLKAILLSFFIVITIGGAWEVFEYVAGLTASTEKYSLDIIHDLIADTFGAVSALLIAKRIVKSS